MKYNFSELFQLKGKTAIVTGGAGILGKHFCNGLAEFGANVVVVDIDKKSADAVANELIKHNIHSMGIQCDISNPLDVHSMVDSVIKKFGSIEILLNNAASKSNDLGAFFAPFESYSIEEWRKVNSVNIDGMFLVAQAVGAQMVKQKKGGAIMQTSSIYGIMAPDHSIYEGSFYLDHQINTPAVYSTSKAGVIGLTKYLATYWAKENIRVNCLAPGGVSSGQNETFTNNYSRRIPLNRMAEAHEMVAPMLYLVSDASSFVTGQVIAVDGGLSAW